MYGWHFFRPKMQLSLYLTLWFFPLATTLSYYVINCTAFSISLGERYTAIFSAVQHFLIDGFDEDSRQVLLTNNMHYWVSQYAGTSSH